MLGVERAAGAQRNLVLPSPRNLTEECRTRGHIGVRGPVLHGGGTSRAVGERRNGSVRNSGLRVELTVRPAESNALPTSPNVGGIVRVGGLHIRPRGGFGEVHLGATSLRIQRCRQLAAGSAFLALLIGQAGLLTVSSVRTLEVQVLRS